MNIKGFDSIIDSIEEQWNTFFLFLYFPISG